MAIVPGSKAAPARPSKPLERGRARRGWAAAAAGALLAGGVSLTPLAVLDTAAASPGPAAAVAHRGKVIANLWEWNWPSVGRECTNVLGPKGYGGVQVAPPQDSLSRTEAVDPPVLHPWWEVYQPVRYKLTSRMGDGDQFRAMVDTCRKAGVKVYVDAVINHMTGQGEVSYGGVHYTKYEYGKLYSSKNFHHYPGACPQPDGTIHDFNNYLEVTKCELLGLSDLRTGSTYVRDRIVRYLNRLISYGVSGFRVDAAKHIGQTDLGAIRERLHDTVDGTRPYVALEVFPGGPGKLAPEAFESVGHLLGFDFAYQVHDAFKSYTTPGGNITDLEIFGERSGLLPRRKTLVFVENHDTERNGSTLSYKDAATNVLATQFMLARGYGRPEVYASFKFEGNDDSPPADADGFISDTDCSSGWVCTDRFRRVVNMVGWHNYVGRAPLANWYDDGVNLIAFSRGDRGWIAINNHEDAQRATFQTGLAAGTYCDVTRGDYSKGSCTGRTVTVRSDGTATVSIRGKSSVAFDASDLVRG